MRRTDLKHTVIAFITLLTLVGTTPAMAGAPAAMKTKSASSSGKVQPRNAKGQFTTAGSLAFGKMADQLETKSEAKPAKGPGLVSKLFNMTTMRSGTKATLLKAKAAQLEGKMEVASAHLSTVEPAGLRERLALGRATNSVNKAVKTIENDKIKEASKAEAEVARAQKAAAPTNPGIFSRMFKVSSEQKEAVSMAKTAREEGRFADAQNHLLSAPQPNSLRARFGMWNAARKLRNASASAAKELVKTGNFEQGIEALRVAESMTSDGRISQFRTARAQNSVFKKAMSIAEKASKDKTDPYALELVQTAIQTAQRSGSDKVNIDTLRSVLTKAKGNHVESLATTAERLMNEGEPEAAGRAIAEIQHLTADRGYKSPGFLSQRRMNRVLSAIPEHVETQYNEMQHEHAAEARGMTYVRPNVGAEAKATFAEMQTMAKAQGRPVMTVFNDKEVIVDADTTFKSVSKSFE